MSHPTSLAARPWGRARATRALSDGRRAGAETSSRWRLSWMSVLIAMIALVGLGVFMYPSTAAWWSSYNQSKTLVENQAAVLQDLAPGNERRVADAHQYNDLLTTGAITVGADAHKPTTEGSDAAAFGLDYDELLAGREGIMARIKIPVIDVDLPVYHGTSDEVLLKGAGHLQGTALPVGGLGTRSVISAHRGLASATMFNHLDKLEIGDRFVVETFGEVLTYQVIEKQVVEPSDTETVLPRPDEDLVTLVTCTPLGINTHRILVTGERITPTPIGDIEAAGAVPEVPGFPWWAVIISSGIVLAGVYVWRSGYPAKPKKAEAPTA